MMGQVVYLENNKGATRVGEFWGRIWYSYIYPNFGHRDNTMMVGMTKALEGELSIEPTSHAHGDW